jgi:hypothetical protein
MGRRDYRHREPKKPKKDARKISPVTLIPTPIQVEVIGKRKKKREEVEGGEE